MTCLHRWSGSMSRDESICGEHGRVHAHTTRAVRDERGSGRDTASSRSIVIPGDQLRSVVASGAPRTANQPAAQPAPPTLPTRHPPTTEVTCARLAHIPPRFVSGFLPSHAAARRSLRPPRAAPESVTSCQKKYRPPRAPPSHAGGRRGSSPCRTATSPCHG